MDMASISSDFLSFFGNIKFAEENSMVVSDFERSLHRFLTSKEKTPHGSYKFGEIDNKYSKDFENSFKHFFE
ncbi:MAG: hypothetical protein GF353_19325 [Candidatus Lokiarchaeota archaeon]|nr:hypothetical protein [Candidatus Lokiarchaeota archaeon]